MIRTAGGSAIGKMVVDHLNREGAKRLAAWGKPATPRPVDPRAEAARTHAMRAQVERFATAYANAARRAFSTVLVGMGPADAGLQHSLELRLQVAESPDAAFGKTVAEYLAAHPGRRIVGHSTATVPSPCEVTSQRSEGVQTRETLEPAVDGAGCLVETTAARTGTKVYAFAATHCAMGHMHEYTLVQRFVHAASMAQATDDFRASLLAEHPEHAVLCLRGKEVPMRRQGAVAGPHGGALTMIETVTHDRGGHIQSIVSERF
jgi:hypothetical protein